MEQVHEYQINEANMRSRHGLHIVPSDTGTDRWHALWDWLLEANPSTKLAAREPEVANGDSQG